ncbi:MAG: multiheme c-type cytochrome [Myxococcota bacterium]
MSPAVLGLGALDRPLDVDWTSAEACRECHPQEVADWSGSRHRAAWTNELLFDGYVQETQPFCVYCHAPLRDQAAEISANTAFYRSRDPSSGLPPAPLLPEPRAAEGVTCAVCHLRDGAVLAVDGAGPHRFVAAPELGSGELCGSCHQFPFPLFLDGRTVTTDAWMQRTWSEWTEWREAGGAETCQDCHMPAGRHTFRGAHDLAFLAGAVDVQVERATGGVRFVVSSVGVGHDLPTGDLFRHLTLEVDPGDGRWLEVARIGRTFRTRWDPALGATVKEPDGDGSLHPGAPAQWTVPRAVAWRLRYHYASERDEARGRLPLDEIVAVLAQGNVP